MLSKVLSYNSWCIEWQQLVWVDRNKDGSSVGVDMLCIVAHLKVLQERFFSEVKQGSHVLDWCEIGFEAGHGVVLIVQVTQRVWGWGGGRGSESKIERGR